MDFILLTQNSTPIIGFLSRILGVIFDGIYYGLSFIGIENVAICIIIFTFIVRLFLFPMTIKQQKYSKVNSVISPEIREIQKKYEGKKDEKSRMDMQAEISAVYEKYGASPAGSCLQLIIQLPIMFALYYVVSNVAAYITPLKEQYLNIINKLSVSEITHYFQNDSFKFADPSKLTADDKNIIIDIMSNARSAKILNFDMAKMVSEVSDRSIEGIYKGIEKANEFFCYNLNLSPKDMWSGTENFKSIGWLALIIPIAAGLFQFISSFLTQSMNPTPKNDDDENGAMFNSMKIMMMVFPLFSVWLCWSFPAGLGLYWIVGSVVMLIFQIVMYFYFKKVTIEDIINESKKKAQKKREKRGITANAINQAASVNTRNISKTSSSGLTAAEKEEKLRQANEKFSNKSSGGSISSRATMNLSDEKYDRKR